MAFGANVAMGEATVDGNASEVSGRSEHLGKANPYGCDPRGQNLCARGTTRRQCDVRSF